MVLTKHYFSIDICQEEFKRNAIIYPVVVSLRTNFWHHRRKMCIHCIDYRIRIDFVRPALGGAKFISFEERHWHSDCFVCYRCQVSLVGRGFITDNAEVLCPDCGRA